MLKVFFFFYLAEIGLAITGFNWAGWTWTSPTLVELHCKTHVYVGLSEVSEIQLMISLWSLVQVCV